MQRPFFGKYQKSFVAFLLLAEGLLAAAILRGLLCEYAQPGTSIRVLSSRTLTGVVSGHGPARTDVITLCASTVVFLILAIAPFPRAASTRGEASRRTTNPVNVPLAQFWWRFSLLAACEITLSAGSVLYVASRAGFHWTYGGGRFIQYFVRGFWQDGGLAPGGGFLRCWFGARAPQLWSSE